MQFYGGGGGSPSVSGHLFLWMFFVFHTLRNRSTMRLRVLFLFQCEYEFWCYRVHKCIFHGISNFFRQKLTFSFLLLSYCILILKRNILLHFKTKQSVIIRNKFISLQRLSVFLNRKINMNLRCFWGRSTQKKYYFFYNIIKVEFLNYGWLYNVKNLQH